MSPAASDMHREHRRAFLERLAERHAAAVVFTATSKLRNGDAEHRFRPDSDFWYLTGFAEAEAVLVLRPGTNGDEPRSVLFLRDKDPEKEVWTGRRLGVAAAPAALGVDAAFPVGALRERLGDLLRGHARVVYRTGQDERRDREVLDVLDELRRTVRGAPVPVELVDPAAMLHEQRLVKGAAELECMRRAADVSREAHLAAMAAARPGAGEHEIDALLEYTFRRRGSTGPAYTNIVAGGANACILHYVENDRRLRDGDLLLVDAGAEWDYYASDVTRTFPVNGRFSPEQRALYEVVLDAQKRGVEAVRPGATMHQVHEVAVRRLCAGLGRLGLLHDPEKALETGAYRRFYMHRTSHWLGLDVHDCGATFTEAGPRPLVPGMVLTVEPGVYVAPDDETVDARWRGIGIRIEDDVLVTADGREVLTAAIPKEVEALEAACAATLETAGVAG
jgi:Xaa-Pro aminopeptidase